MLPAADPLREALSRDATLRRGRLTEGFGALMALLPRSPVEGGGYAAQIDALSSAVTPLIREDLHRLRRFRNRCAHHGEPGSEPMGLAELEEAQGLLTRTSERLRGLIDSGALIPGTLAVIDQAHEQDRRESEGRVFREQLRREREAEEAAERESELLRLRRLEADAEANRVLRAAERTPPAERTPDQRALMVQMERSAQQLYEAQLRAWEQRNPPVGLLRRRTERPEDPRPRRPGR